VLDIEPNSNSYGWFYSDEEGNGGVCYVVKGIIKLHYDGKFVKVKERDEIFIPVGWKYEGYIY
jgi:glyoxylate utilization-related uncharacterized protein